MYADLTYFEFRGIKVFVDSNELIIDGKTIKLKPKEMGVLVMLYRHVDNTISRNDLLDRVWSESGGNDLGLTQAVSRLRKVIGDDAVHPQIIKTIHKKGYQLISGGKLGQSDNVSSSKSLLARIKYNRTQAIIMVLLFIIILLIVTIIIIKPKVIRMRIRKYVIPEKTALATLNFYHADKNLQNTYVYSDASHPDL